MKKHRNRLPDSVLRQRIVEKIIVNGDGCWIWQEAKHDDGYAAFWDGQRTGQAHRIAFEVFRGSVPVGMLVCHKCDVRDCVNHVYRIRRGERWAHVEDDR